MPYSKTARIPIAKAIKRIKNTGLKKETVYYCYVVDQSRKLLGYVDIKEMLIADRNEKIIDIMEDNHYHRIPVVDDKKHLLGLLTAGTIRQSNASSSLSVFEYDDGSAMEKSSRLIEFFSHDSIVISKKTYILNLDLM